MGAGSLHLHGDSGWRLDSLRNALVVPLFKHLCSLAGRSGPEPRLVGCFCANRAGKSILLLIVHTTLWYQRLSDGQFVGDDCGGTFDWGNIAFRGDQCGKFKTDIAFSFLSAILWLLSATIGFAWVRRHESLARRAESAHAANRHRWFGV